MKGSSDMLKTLVNRMTDKLSNGAKSAIVYTLATLFSRGLAIITVPIFTRIMTSSDIGVSILGVSILLM